MASAPGRVASILRSWISGPQVLVARQLHNGPAVCCRGSNCRALQKHSPLFSTPLGSRTYLSLQYSGVKSWEENKAKAEGFDRGKLRPSCV